LENKHDKYIKNKFNSRSVRARNLIDPKKNIKINEWLQAGI